MEKKIVKQYHHNGRVKVEYETYNNILCGYLKQYTMGGKLWKECNYKLGMRFDGTYEEISYLDGEYKEWDRENTDILKIHCLYKNGSLTKECKMYYEIDTRQKEKIEEKKDQTIKKEKVTDNGILSTQENGQILWI